MNLDSLKFDENGLIPAIVQDAKTGRVLTLAYMNRESLEITLAEGRTCFWSRSRKTLWRKGETSGNVQRVVDITADCDADALVVRVDKAGPACHLGTDSCFENRLFTAQDGDGEKGEFSIDSLHELLLSRNRERPANSYTTYLFEKGREKILKKVQAVLLKPEVKQAGKEQIKKKARESIKEKLAKGKLVWQMALPFSFRERISIKPSAGMTDPSAAMRFSSANRPNCTERISPLFPMPKVSSLPRILESDTFAFWRSL